MQGFSQAIAPPPAPGTRGPPSLPCYVYHELQQIFIYWGPNELLSIVQSHPAPTPTPALPTSAAPADTGTDESTSDTGPATTPPPDTTTETATATAAVSDTATETSGPALGDITTAGGAAANASASGSNPGNATNSTT